MILYDEDDRDWVAETAIANNSAIPEEISLFKQLDVTMRLDDNKNYNVIGSSIGDGLNFDITTQYPDGLPENVGALFFNIDNNFDVNIVESKQCANIGQRLFKINVKKT